MLKIYITRHGRNFDNQDEILGGHRNRPLTSKGIKQACFLANKINEITLEFEAMYSSPLCRCTQLAGILWCRLLMPEPRPRILPLLIERDFGIMTGQKVSDIEYLCDPKDIFKTEKVTYFMAPEGGETFSMVRVRAKKLLKMIYANHKEGNILLVGHGDIGMMLFAVFHGLKTKEALKMFYFGNCDLIQLVKGKPHTHHLIFMDQNI